MNKTGLLIVVTASLLTVLLFGYLFAPGFRAAINTELHAVQMADDATRYETRKQVEDTCRAMVASYNADVMTWEQYKDSDGEQRSWADQARMRANKTAATYNAFVRQNSYVWADNVPKDIRSELPAVEE